jgi:hypothetical protein
MQKTIEVDGKPVAFKATASTARRYRQAFNRDLLIDMQSLTDSVGNGQTLSASALETFENIAYTMAKQADDTIPGTADEWLDGFGMFPIYEILPQIIELWGISTQTLETGKKK